MTLNDEEIEDNQRGMLFVNKEAKQELLLGINDLPTQKYFYLQTLYEDLLQTHTEHQWSWLHNVKKVRQM